MGNDIDYSAVAKRWKSKHPTHRVDLTGDYETTIYDAARRLLAEGADPADTVETWRGGKLSMSGQVGELAKWTVVFASSGPRLVRHKTCISGRQAAETLAPVVVADAP